MMAFDKSLLAGSSTMLILKLLEEKRVEWDAYTKAVSRVLQGGASLAAV